MAKGEGSFVCCRRRKSIRIGYNISWNWIQYTRHEGAIEDIPLGSMSVKVVQDMIQPPSDKVIFPEDSVEGLVILEGGSKSFVGDGFGQHSGELDGRSTNEVVSLVGGIHGGGRRRHVVSSKVFSGSS